MPHRAMDRITFMFAELVVAAFGPKWYGRSVEHHCCCLLSRVYCQRLCSHMSETMEVIEALAFVISSLILCRRSVLEGWCGGIS